MEDMEKERALVEHDRRLLAALRKERARTEILADAVRAAVYKLPPVKRAKVEDVPAQKLRIAGKSETAVMLISDIEIGKAVVPEECGGLNNYNLSIIQKRADVIRKSVSDILRIHNCAYPISDLYVALLGDIVGGDNTSGKWSSVFHELNIVEQIFAGTNIIVNVLLDWIVRIPKTTVLCVPGNHGRVGKPGEEKYYVNWDYLAYVFLAERLRHLPRIKFKITQSWFIEEKIRNTQLLFLHGDDVRGWASLPFYGITKQHAAMQQLCGRFFDAICMGHHHQPAQIPVNQHQTIINGCWCGGDMYSMKRLRAASRPTQVMFGICDKGLTWRYDIDLTRK